MNRSLPLAAALAALAAAAPLLPSPAALAAAAPPRDRLICTAGRDSLCLLAAPTPGGGHAFGSPVHVVARRHGGTDFRVLPAGFVNAGTVGAPTRAARRWRLLHLGVPIDLIEVAGNAHLCLDAPRAVPEPPQLAQLSLGPCGQAFFAWPAGGGALTPAFASGAVPRDGQPRDLAHARGAGADNLVITCVASDGAGGPAFLVPLPEDPQRWVTSVPFR
jgi:hypothetical protein